MPSGREAMMVVRAELCGCLDRLEGRTRTMSARAFAENVAGMRQLAATYGLAPVVALASKLEQSPSRNARALYLQQLADAIRCEQPDTCATEALAASVAIRLGA